MKKLFALVIWTILSTTCLKSQGLSTDSEQRQDVHKQIDALIPSGEIMVDVMDSTSPSPRRIEMFERIQSAVLDHPDIARDIYNSRHDRSELIRLYGKIGFSEEEFEEFERMMTDMSDMAVHRTATELVLVSKNEGRIRFRSSNKLDFLNELIIDLPSNTVSLNGYSLTEFDTTIVENPNNEFGSSYHGYVWRYKEGIWNNPETVDGKSKDGKYYWVLLGRLDKDGRTLLQVVGMETGKSNPDINYSVPLLFNN